MGSRYIGVYMDKWFGKIEVFKRDGQLSIRSYRSPKLVGNMYFYNGNTFAIKWDDRELLADALPCSRWMRKAKPMDSK